MGREKCDKCGCNVFHENESDKLKCANKTDGSMEEAQQAFEEWFYNYDGINKHEGDAIEVGWLAGVQWEQNRVKPSYVTPLEIINDCLVNSCVNRFEEKALEQLGAYFDNRIEKLQAELDNAKQFIADNVDPSYFKEGDDDHLYFSKCHYEMYPENYDSDPVAYLEKYKGGDR